MKHIHFIGISGAGLSALAQVMLGRGWLVSGSDPAAPNPVTVELERQGAKIFSQHRAENIEGADLIVPTSAAQESNPEIEAARSRKIPVLKRREFLSELTSSYDTIAVAGSHGKTTTTAMIGLMLAEAGFDPTVVVGGVVPGWNTNARVGSSKWFVIEADEYDYAFLGLAPKIAVLTNVDYDHPDVFATRALYKEAFTNFLKQTRADGAVVVCGDERAASNSAEAAERKVIRYGRRAENEWRASEIHANANGGSDFEIFHHNQFLGVASLQVPGEHNVLNALAAVATAQTAGVTIPQAIQTVSDFTGVGRRFQVRGTYQGAIIIDDYAHHPTEIRASLDAARSRFPGAKIFVLFQPHTFSRTRALVDEFASAFASADRVLITEIYAARERDDTGLSSRMIVERMRGNSRYVETLDEAERILRQELGAGNVLLTLGAGNVNQVAERLVPAGRHESGNA